jgi:phosphotransferase system HPr-like phosphotransfer protein
MKSAKSIMALMGLSLKHEQDFTLVVEGPDAEVAVGTLTELVNNEFKI